MARRGEKTMTGSRILVMHAWLKGNLGDVLQLSVLLRAVRELQPRTLDLAGYPARPAPETNEVLRLADRYIADPFPWYWSLLPAHAGAAIIAPWWKRGRRALFSRYDAIVCAPGPYLASYDPRSVSALCDITVASSLGLPVVLSSHSIGPLDSNGIAVISQAAVRVARESVTHEYLHAHGVSAVLSADFAFLYPYATVEGRAPLDESYRAVFLRSNNLVADRLRIEHGALFEGSRLIAERTTERMILATSDYRRDGRFLAKASQTLGVPWIACRSVGDLVGLIRRSSGVVSDRYHPAICAAVLGKPAQVIPNREPHKMQGLTNLLADRTLDRLQALARTGLDTVRATLRETV
jgi:polysaccharide pyruvyl transferase WcaK-like protein